VDVARGEAVEKMLDSMIERRSRQQDPDEGSELWRQCVPRHNVLRSELWRASWQKGYHLASVERLRAVLASLVEHYERERASAEAVE